MTVEEAIKVLNNKKMANRQTNFKLIDNKSRRGSGDKGPKRPSTRDLLMQLINDVNGLKSDVNTLKSDVSSLKTDVNELKEGMLALNTRIDNIVLKNNLKEQKLTTLK